jgi:hypothetical protein
MLVRGFLVAVRAVDGLLSPERFLTKICMVSSGSAEEAREETLEMLLERMVVLRVGCCKGGGGDVKTTVFLSDQGERVDG